MDVNYKFIESLIFLQYPEIRLREALTKLVAIAGEKQNGLDELKYMIEDSELMGKYNKKFCQDWGPKIKRIINKV